MGRAERDRAPDRARSRTDGLRRALVVLLAVPLLCAFEPFRRPMGSVEQGNTLLAQGKPKEALAQYDRALKEQPDLPGVRYDRGVALERLGKLDEARQALLRSTQARDPALRSKAFYNLGHVLYQLKRPEEAVAAYQNALRVDPGHQAAKWNLELALRQLEEQKKDQQKKDQQKKDQQKKDQQKQDQQKQDQQKKDQPKQDQQKQDQQKQDQQKQDQQKQDQQKQPPGAQPQKQPAADPAQRAEQERLKQLLDALDRNDQSLQRRRARMLRERRRPPDKDW